MHDAHEAIIGDVSSPLKCALRAMRSYALDDIDKLHAEAVRERWPHRYEHAPIKLADLQALATERRDLLGPEARPWNLAVDGKEIEPWPQRIVPWDFETSKRMFLERFEELFPSSASSHWGP